MEKQCRKIKKKADSASALRSPLRDVNGIRNHVVDRKSRTTNTSGAVSAVSVGVPKGCLGFASSSIGSSSASLGAVVEKELRSVARVAAGSKVLHRSEENGVQRKPFPEKFRRRQPPSVYQRQFGKINPESILKNDRRSKLSCAQANPVDKLKKMPSGFGQIRKNFTENLSGEPAVEVELSDNCSLAGKNSCRSFEISNFDKGLTEDFSIAKSKSGNGATSFKTPPVEASVSPEIQSGAHLKMRVSSEAATPVCYGAGHLLSGVKDKRKCRSRGILIGNERTNLFSDDMYDEKVNDSLASLIRMPIDASVRWLLSPCDEECEDHQSDSGKLIDQNQITVDHAFDALEPSAWALFENDSDLASGSSGYSCRGVTRDAANKKTRTIMHHPGKSLEFPGLLGTPNDERIVCVSLKEGESCRHKMARDNYAMSTGSESNGNIMQTPDIESSSDVCVGRTGLNADQSKLSIFELDSIATSISRMKLSSQTKMPESNIPGLDLYFQEMGLPSNSVGVNGIQKNVECTSSWISEYALEDLALTQMRISWRDGLASRIAAADEFDSCLCSSDEEVDAYQCPSVSSAKNIMNSCLQSYQDTKFCVNDENHMGFSSDFSLEALDHKTINSTRKEEETFTQRHDACKESICTNGGDVVASADSDWANCFENHLSQV